MIDVIISMNKDYYNSKLGSFLNAITCLISKEFQVVFII